MTFQVQSKCVDYDDSFCCTSQTRPLVSPFIILKGRKLCSSWAVGKDVLGLGALGLLQGVGCFLGRGEDVLGLGALS